MKQTQLSRSGQAWICLWTLSLHLFQKSVSLSKDFKVEELLTLFATSEANMTSRVDFFLAIRKEETVSLLAFGNTWSTRTLCTQRARDFVFSTPFRCRKFFKTTERSRSFNSKSFACQVEISNRANEASLLDEDWTVSFLALSFSFFDCRILIPSWLLWNEWDWNGKRESSCLETASKTRLKE